MANEKTYKCVQCLKITGTPVKDKPKEEDWYWNEDPYLTGPFCSTTCLNNFSKLTSALQEVKQLGGSHLIERYKAMRQAYADEVHIGIFTMHWSRNTIVPESERVHGGDLGPVPNIASNADACHRLDLVVGQGAQGEMGC